MKYNGPLSFRARVKICGLTSLADSLAAIEAGADALGFNFYEKSPRYLAPKKAEAILRRLPPLVSVVGVFVNPKIEDMLRIIGRCRLDHFQIHGELAEKVMGMFPPDKLIRAVAVKDKRGLKKIAASRVCGAVLLDAPAKGLYGGTGRAFDWSLARWARTRLKVPLILAGGLNEKNVAQAVRVAGPFAVDVCSGVESSPGRKDALKMRRFVAEAKSVAQAFTAPAL
jgi:phosphoribosylanthranilate isomerase